MGWAEAIERSRLQLGSVSARVGWDSGVDEMCVTVRVHPRFARSLRSRLLISIHAVMLLVSHTTGSLEPEMNSRRALGAISVLRRPSHGLVFATDSL